MMCNQVRTYLSPYLDSELDPTTTYVVARHLEGCPDCARVFSGEHDLERAITERLARPQGDEERIVDRALSGALAHGRRSALHWIIAASVLISIVVLGYRLESSKDQVRSVPMLVAMAADDHSRLLAGEIGPEIMSGDPAALKSFFSGRLSGDTGSLPNSAGWQVDGARLCRFRGVPVAYFALRYHDIPISVVDVSQGDAQHVADDETIARASGRCFEFGGGRAILRRASHGLRVVFGNVERARLEEVASAAR